MAIEDFGKSLLADVRARKDQQTKDARSYARKQQNRDLLKALVLPSVFSGFQDLVGIGNQRVVDKTNEFLNNTSFQNNQIKVDLAGKKITKALEYKKFADDNEITLKDAIAQMEADSRLTQERIVFPNLIKDDTIDEYKATLLQSQDFKNEIEKITDFNQYVLDNAEKYNTGRSRKTLEQLAEQRTPKTFLGSIVRNITGNTTTGDVFNQQMEKLDQVIVANSINEKDAQLTKELAIIAADEGNTDLAKQISGINFTDKDKKFLQERLKAGDSVEVDTELRAVTGTGLFGVTTTITTPQGGGNPEVEFKEELLAKTNGNPNADDATKYTSSVQSVFNLIKDLYNKKGATDFTKKVAELSKDKTMNSALFQEISQLAYSGTFTDSGNIREDLSPSESGKILDTYLTPILRLNEDIINNRKTLASNFTTDAQVHAHNQKYFDLLIKRESLVKAMSDFVDLGDQPILDIESGFDKIGSFTRGEILEKAMKNNVDLDQLIKIVASNPTQPLDKSVSYLKSLSIN